MIYIIHNIIHIVHQIGELVKMSGGTVDERLADQFQDITQTILENQNEALGNLTTKVILSFDCIF